MSTSSSGGGVAVAGMLFKYKASVDSDGVGGWMGKGVRRMRKNKKKLRLEALKTLPAIHIKAMRVPRVRSASLCIKVLLNSPKKNLGTLYCCKSPTSG